MTHDDFLSFSENKIGKKNDGTHSRLVYVHYMKAMQASGYHRFLLSTFLKISHFVF